MKISVHLGVSVVGLFAYQGGAAAPEPVCPPAIQWDRTLGGAGTDFFSGMLLAPDGNFLAFGLSDPDSIRSQAFGGMDGWVTLVATNGALIWERSFGGNALDAVTTAAVTSDGGFILGGLSWSGAAGNKTSPNFGSYDYWLIRLAADGTKLWDTSFGGSAEDQLESVLQTADGGFLLAGTSQSPISGNKTSPRFDATPYTADLWVVRTDAQGNKLWDRTYGGTMTEGNAALAPAADGGFLLGGTSRSGLDGNKETDSFGWSDFWVLRLNDNGDILWQRSFGGADFDNLRSITPTGDGGYLLAGESTSWPGGNKTSANFGSYDYWIVRIDSAGNPLWDASFGGGGYDELSTTRKLTDGGFILGGTSYSAADANKTSEWRGESDYWVVRVDASGNKLWEQSYGALRSEGCREILPLADGGFLLGGSSDSPKRGMKSAPLLGQSDFWLVRLGRETPGDCDGDGVPDVADRCPGTSFGNVTDAQGCGLAQACPCDAAWPALTHYIACVESNSARFLAAGTITVAQREAILHAAFEADCPPTPRSLVAFGLTNVFLGDADITAVAESSQLNIIAIGPEGRDGVSLRLGQADSGVFISPYADTWGSYSESWFLLGTAYGKLNGQPNARIASLRARKPYYETYPVEVDLSPLQPASVTWQVWSNNVLLIEATDTAPGGEVVVNSSSTVGPRANPFWRQPDGSVGAMIEFLEPVGDTTRVTGPFGETTGGNRIFIRANAPTNSVEYISRFDVVAGGGLGGFALLDERPGVFGRVHRMLGPGLLVPSLGRLQIANPSLGSEDHEHVGVLVEIREEQRLHFSFEPFALTNEFASLQLTPSGWWTDASDALGTLTFNRGTNHISLTSYLNTTEPVLDLRVYRHGLWQGVVPVTNGTEIGRLLLSEPNHVPHFIGAGSGIEATGSIITMSFTLDRVTPFQGPDGSLWHGDHFQIVGTNASPLASPLSSLALLSYNVPAIVITAEDSSGAPPKLDLVQRDHGFLLSWPARNLPLILEASSTLPGHFTPVTSEVTYEQGRYRVSLSATDASQRFFRLRRP